VKYFFETNSLTRSEYVAKIEWESKNILAATLYTKKKELIVIINIRGHAARASARHSHAADGPGTAAH
jgi:hypothetical protein